MWASRTFHIDLLVSLSINACFTLRTVSSFARVCVWVCVIEISRQIMYPWLSNWLWDLECDFIICALIRQYDKMQGSKWSRKTGIVYTQTHVRTNVNYAKVDQVYTVIKCVRCNISRFVFHVNIDGLYSRRLHVNQSDGPHVE